MWRHQTALSPSAFRSLSPETSRKEEAAEIQAIALSALILILKSVNLVTVNLLYPSIFLWFNSLRSWQDLWVGKRQQSRHIREQRNSTLHQSSHGFATRIHGFVTKTKALAREIPPATQVNDLINSCLLHMKWSCCDLLIGQCLFLHIPISI